jgi:hypothetical protein
MLTNMGSSIMMMLLGVIFFIVLAPNLIQQAEDSRVQQVLDLSKTCTTGTSVPATCTFTLPTPHEYVGNTALQVDETSTVATNRQTLSISGLDQPNTQYNFLIDYWEKKTDIADTLNGVLRFFPLMVILGIVGSVVIATLRRN